MSFGVECARRSAAAAAVFALFSSFTLTAQTLPSGTEIQIRLRQTLSSFGSRQGDEIRAVVIAPVMAEGAVVIPLGAEILGTVSDTRRVGLGFAREAAWIRVEFNALRLPGERDAALAGRIAKIDNSREAVDAQGRIKGIRATASLSSVLSGVALSAAALDPMLLAFGFASSLSMFRIPESEIVLPTGTELRFQTTEPVSLTKTFPPAAPPLARSDEQRERLQAVIKGLPFRTTTEGANIPSDLTNLAFLGSEKAVKAAFDAAGWVITDVRDARSSIGAMRSIVENQGYKEAPMSTLLLDGKPPAVTYSKTLNTFFERHHLRVFAQEPVFEGQPVWSSSSTHDSGIGFSVGQKTFIHLIDENIDEERDKVVNDMILTGCVSGVEIVARPWVPLDASNSTGDKLVTDGRIAVIRLNECTNPIRADAPAPGAESVGTRPNLPGRATRNTMLTLRNDILRGNIVYQGYEGIRSSVHVIKARNTKKNPAAEPPAFNYAGQSWKIVAGAQKLAPAHGAPREPGMRGSTFQTTRAQPENWATFLEFSASGGYSRFGNSRFSTQPIVLNLVLPEGFLAQAGAEGVSALRPGWNIAGSTTFNAHRRFSHELGFALNATKFAITFQVPVINSRSVLKQDAQIRQFHYALLIHARPNGARLRPYLAVGGGMQSVRLTEAAEEGNPYLKFFFKDANIIYSAFRFGSLPPLEGGGIFQPTAHYGVGVKYHASRRLVLRADYRETLSAQPDFWTKSYPSLLSLQFSGGGYLGLPPLVKEGVMRHQRISLGVGITF
ncbi:MAG: LssY C-terminal domain-containing protein [Acidobacteria bacterium]|nr:LssY C-terminal domain-containing protein [Acidobacteriota bacterium]